jgi:hypothetical protein
MTQIGVRERDRRSIRYTISDTWMAVQAEMKTIISDYLMDSNRTLPPVAFNFDLSASKEKTNVARPLLFRFADSASVSTLDQGSGSQSATFAAAGIVDKLTVNAENTGHRRLVPSTIFNLPTILKPALDFVNRIDMQYFSMLVKVDFVFIPSICVGAIKRMKWKHT